MKNLNSLFIAALLSSSTPAFLACSSEDTIEEVDESTLVVSFTDAEVADYVRGELELGAGAPITRGDLTKLTTFNISGNHPEVESLQGLQYATELTSINLGGTRVTDLSPLADLQKVTYLRMHETPVVDLSPVSAYTTLTYFNANQAGGITDISALRNNTGLQELILRGNPIGNGMLETLRNFTSLHRLNARATDLTDISAIGELMAQGALLRTTAGFYEESELNLRDNNITDFTPIQSYITDGTAVPVSR